MCSKCVYLGGGKLFDDYHAARVLPGFEKPDSKLKMLLS